MRLFYLSVAEIPSRLASSVHVMKMCRAFAKYGHEVVLFARGGSEKTADPFAFYACEPSFRIEICSGPHVGLLGKVAHPIKAALRIRSQDTPDLLYARHLYSLALAAPLGAPMIFEAHVLPRSMAERRLQEWLFRRANFRRLITISDALRQDYQELFPWLRDPYVLVAHDGADLPQTTGCGPKRWHERLQVGYVGSLYPGKGMEIVAAMAKQMPEVDFHVVGGAEDDLRQWRACAPYSNLRFHGFLPHGDLPAVYAYLDISLAPLQRRIATRAGTDDIARWTSPLKIFEYMAHGIPIVCSDLPVLREILSHGRNAWLVSPDSLEDWIAAVRTLAIDSALRAKLAEAARQEIEAKYSWDHRAERVLEGLQ